MQHVTWGPPEVGGYDQPRGWSNSRAKERDLHLIGLWVARFPTQGCQGFPGLDFNLQVPDEEEAKESVFEDEADPEVFSDAPSLVPLPSEAKTPAEAGSSPSPTGALSFDLHSSEASTIEAARGSPSNI